MIEILDNSVQLAVMAACSAVSWALASKRRRQAYAILACYYGSLSMGLLYWLAYDIITSYTPKIFYVSDLCWVSSYLFLLMLVTQTSGPEENAFRHPAAWLSPALAAVMTVFYCHWGDCVENIIWCGLMGASGWFSVRGCIWAVRSGQTDRRNFHLAVLLLIVVEYCLWTASCFWTDDTLANPYFWFDFSLTATGALLLPATVKVVGK
jgi:hypothetical protein